MTTLHPIFGRLFADMASHGLLPADEQVPGTTVPDRPAGGADEHQAGARRSTPIPYLPGHAGKEL